MSQYRRTRPRASQTHYHLHAPHATWTAAGAGLAAAKREAREEVRTGSHGDVIAIQDPRTLERVYEVEHVGASFPHGERVRGRSLRRG